MRIHLVAGLKGGAGRTLSAFLLALGLAALGRAVAVIAAVRQKDEAELICQGPEPPFLILRYELDRTSWSLERAAEPWAASFPDMRVIRHLVGIEELVVDWPNVHPGRALGLIGRAHSLLLPVRPDPISVEAAVRTWLKLIEFSGRDRDGFSVDTPMGPPRFLPIDPPGGKADPAAIRACLDSFTPEDDYDTTQVVLPEALPHLSDKVLDDLVQERRWWTAQGLAERARLVAEAVDAAAASTEEPEYEEVWPLTQRPDSDRKLNDQ